MSTKNISLALLAVALTIGLGTVANAHRNLMERTAATAPLNCATTYGTALDANGRSISTVNLTCSRSAQRSADGAAL